MIVYKSYLEELFIKYAFINKSITALSMWVIRCLSKSETWYSCLSKQFAKLLNFAVLKAKKLPVELRALIFVQIVLIFLF